MVTYRPVGRYVRSQRHQEVAVKRHSLAVAAALTLACAAPAAADGPIVAVEDPTPNGAFSGTYVVSCKGKSGKPQKCRESTQDGYVAVYENGVVACNGSTEYKPYDQDGDGANDSVQGYVWVGPGQGATGDKVFETPGGEAGAGSNHGKLSHEPTGKPPCPDEDPEGDGPGR